MSMPINNNKIHVGNNSPMGTPHYLDPLALDEIPPFGGPFGDDPFREVDDTGPEPEPEPEKPAPPKSILKSVFCSYRGSLIVYDVHGKKVPELCGDLTYEKYSEIENRSQQGITEFEGLDDYRCIACELKKKKDDEWDNKFDPFGKPVTGTTGQYVSGNASPTIAIPRSLPPSNPAIGEIYYDTVKNAYSKWTVLGWIELELVPKKHPPQSPASIDE